MATDITNTKKPAQPKKTLEERKAALDLKAMGRRGQITLCIHGINEKYCISCRAKEAAKAARKKPKSTE